MVLSSTFILYLLFIKICFMALYSASLSVLSSGYVINRHSVDKNLTTACLCSGGWLESFGMMISVAIGFL